MKNLTCEIIAVGNELLFGDTVNTNATYISKRLSEEGVVVSKHTVVADDEKSLLSAIDLAVKSNDIIIFSGGLGPTDDDMTKETVAKYLDEELVIDEFSLSMIKEYFELKNKEMSPNNKKQALKLKNGECLENMNGTAPGIHIKKNGVHYFLLPGPPSELRPLFESKVMPILRSVNNMCIHSKTISIMGIGESDMAHKLGSLLNNESNPKVAPYASPGVVKFKITAYGDDEQEVKDLVDKKRDEMYPILSDYILTEENMSIEEVVIDKLKNLGKTVAFAESCTGGMVSASLVDIPSASSVFLKGNVTYSNESKIVDLGVKSEVIDNYGAVSSECAIAMAEGVRDSCGSDYGISITGIAGPSGGSVEKPVGTVYIGVSSDSGTYAKLYNFSGNRERIRFFVSRYALISLLKAVK